MSVEMQSQPSSSKATMKSPPNEFSSERVTHSSEVMSVSSLGALCVLSSSVDNEISISIGCFFPSFVRSEMTV